MKKNYTFEKFNCEQYYIRIDQYSYMKITICENGDLFIDGDYGYWCYAWRSFGESFKRFLIGLGDDYLIAKLESNQISNDGKKTINKHRKEALLNHWHAFQEILKEESK